MATCHHYLDQFVAQTVFKVPVYQPTISISILRAGVQPTLDPYAEAFYSRPNALTLGGEEFSVNDVCKCVRDCRVGGLSRREQLVRYL